MRNILFWGALLAPLSFYSCTDDDNNGNDNILVEDIDGELSNEFYENLSWKVKARNISAVPLNLSGKEMKAVANNNLFANKVLAQLRSNDENTMFSPISLEIALAMLDNGLYSPVQKEVKTALGMQDFSMEEINAFYTKIAESLNSTTDTTSIFESQNSFWAQYGLKLRKNFVDVITDQYKASVANLDFTNPNANDTIDAWANEATHGLIPKLNLELKNTKAILANSCYFKADWAEKMLVDYPITFTDGNGNTIKEAHGISYGSERTMTYAENGSYQAVRLPYGNGTFCMDIVLPANGTSTADLLTKLDWNNLGLKDNTLVEFSMVKFKAENIHKMLNKLKDVGMPSLKRAALDKISDDLILSDIQQNTFIEVDREGTKAAAVTTALAKDGFNERLEEPKKFNVDRPFLFAIREQNTGVILFMGEVVKPEIFTSPFDFFH